MSTSAILIVGGLACLALAGFMFYKLMPQEGKPQSALTGTDMRGTIVAMVLLVLLLAGLGMLAKGIF
ncbi:MAG: hypothetical protein ACT4P3_18675 [Betaproteobacteria bacterium]